jgi:hypothetical protein
MERKHELKRGALAGVAAVTLALTGIAAQAAEHDHEHAAGEAHSLKLNAGKKWRTDAPLRKAMGEIRALLAAQHQAIENDRLKAADYAALGAKVEAQVGYIVQNCKLDPEADANLHLILEDVVAGADAMQGKAKDLTPKAGAGRVIAGLSNYGKYFDHRGWRPIH